MNLEKIIPKRNNFVGKILDIFFSKTFFNVLETSETQFDLFASKIGATLNNLVINGDILVNFLRILSKKSPIHQKNKNR